MNMAEKREWKSSNATTHHDGTVSFEATVSNFHKNGWIWKAETIHLRNNQDESIIEIIVN